MTKLEVLNLALIGICGLMNKEEEINEITKKESGHENSISLARLEKYDKQYDELRELILQEEKKNLNIREFTKRIGFEIVGKLKYIKKENDGTRVYYDEAGNEFYQSNTGICIIDADGGVI